MTWHWYYYLTLIATALISFFPLLPYNLANLVHEASHWAVVRFGYGITGRIKPYWHYSFANKRWESPRYWWDKPLSPDPWMPHHVAPMYADVVLICILTTLIGVIDNNVVQLHLGMPLLGFFGDFLWFWRGYFWGTKNCDGKRWRYGVTQ